MKILVFTEGTVLMHALTKGVSREERVRQSQNIITRFKVTPGSVRDFKNYIPVGNAVEKLNSWKQQGAEIIYLTSRKIKSEIETIKKILSKNNFPGFKNLYFRKQGEEYKDVAERLVPDVLIEDDCESIGGEKEMVYPNIKKELKSKIKSVVIKEFEGIDNLS
jgi:hypothetical protein